MSSIKKSIQVSTSTAGKDAETTDTPKNTTNNLINPNDLLNGNADFSKDEGNQPQKTTRRVNAREKAKEATKPSSQGKFNKFINDSKKYNKISILTFKAK